MSSYWDNRPLIGLIGLIKTDFKRFLDLYSQLLI